MKILSKKTNFIIIMILFGLIIYIITCLTPKIADDFAWGYVSKTGEPITNINQIFVSMKNFYMTQNGRIFGEFYIQLFTLLGKAVFNICNALVYTLVIYLIYKICNPNKDINNMLYIFIHLILWFFVPHFGQVVFWLSGACNYLWLSLPILIMILCFRMHSLDINKLKDTIFKKYTALLFYKLMKLMGAEIIYNHADYRLMSKKALDELEKFKEVNLFLRGIIPMIGFKNSIVEYNRKKRFAGETKYPINNMITFAIEGITSFSVKPLKLITNFGIITSLFSFSYLLYIIIKLLLRKTDTVKGWLTLFSLICLFGGIEILCIGIVGEYIGKIYIEEKERPRYIIDEVLMK